MMANREVRLHKHPDSFLAPTVHRPIHSPHLLDRATLLVHKVKTAPEKALGEAVPLRRQVSSHFSLQRFLEGELQVQELGVQHIILPLEHGRVQMEKLERYEHLRQ